MILLFFLTGKFPLFQSSDDVEALMEIAVIIGRQKMERVAVMHSRTFATNVPSVTPNGISWREFVERQNPTLREPPTPDPRFYPYSTSSTIPSSSSPTSESMREQHVADVEAALALLEDVMQPDVTRRITPRGALYHPFLAPSPSSFSGGNGDVVEVDEVELGDDDVFPSPFGEGACAKDHFVDEVTEEPCVWVRDEDGNKVVRRLVAGEGMAIGRWPCEFHRGEFGPEDSEWGEMG